MRICFNVIVPWRQLQRDALIALLEDIVTRDGTDYGLVEKSTGEKVARALRELEAGRAQISWDARLQSGNLVSTESGDSL